MTAARSHNGVPPAVLQQLAGAAAAVAGMRTSMLEQRSLHQALKRRQTACGLGDPGAYAEFHSSNTVEQAAFLEEVLIGETSFFRDAAVFEQMSRWCNAWFATNSGVMRILSAPCSTGEEPYSIAAMLEQANVPLYRFVIHAMDISEAAIKLARAATYKGFALRNLVAPERLPWLEPAAEGWRVRRRLRSRVQFKQANLMDEGLLSTGPYDLICSRNLLLYQSAAARSHMARSLSAALAPGGRLIIGSADWGRDLDELFVLEEPVHSFALRVREKKSTPTSSPVRHSATETEPPQQTSVSPQRSLSHTLVSPAASRQLARVSDIYREALQFHLRDEDREAERLCRQALYLQPDYLPAMELLGKIHRPHASPRTQRALRARLKRHRDSASADAVQEKGR